MKLLIFDTETTGFPHEEERVVQFAAKVVKIVKGQKPFTVTEFNSLVKTDRAVRPQAEETHGISMLMASFGVTQRSMCNWFVAQMHECDYVVAHNIKFDLKFMTMACTREGLLFPSPKSICTMDLSKPIVKIPPTAKMVAAGRHAPKPPKLEEAYKFFFDKDLEGAHDALVDVRACSDILFELVERKHLYLT